MLAILLLTAIAPARAHGPGERLDPEERKRLRHELRRHALSARAPAEAEFAGPRPVADPPAARPGMEGVPPGLPPAAAAAVPGPTEAERPGPPAGVMRQGHPGHARHGPRRFDPESGATPLSVEERRQLRLQLLEERRRRLEDPSR